MFQFHKRAIGLSLGLVMLTLLILGSAATAFADGGPVTATADLGAGSLSATATSVDTSGFVLSGANQIYSYTLPVAVADATGSNLGWNLTITSTQFTSAIGSHTLAADASTITAVTITPGVGTTPTAASLAYPLTINATAVKFFSATAGTGMGSSTITPTIDVGVPGGTAPGSYTSTITVASVSAP